MSVKNVLIAAGGVGVAALLTWAIVEVLREGDGNSSNAGANTLPRRRRPIPTGAGREFNHGNSGGFYDGFVDLYESSSNGDWGSGGDGGGGD